MSRFELSNGLRVVLVRDPSADEVQVTMRYAVGSVDDPPGQEGIAHLVEHMMFQQALGGRSLFAHLEDVTSYFNGFTTPDATTYVARAQASHLDELLSIEAVRVGFRCTTITDSAFEREREVVMNELRDRGEARALSAAIHRGLYPEGHPYRTSISDSPEIVAQITKAQACAFADAHYTPGNAALVISGDITVEQVDAALGKFLARVARRQATAQVPIAAVPAAPRRIEIKAPIDDDGFIIAWPLADDPVMRTRMRALVRTLADFADSEIKGHAVVQQFGDTHAPMIGILVMPSTDETFDQAFAGVRRGIARLGPTIAHVNLHPYGELVFDLLQQGAIYRSFAKLEDTGTRDDTLASYALAGGDPTGEIGAELTGIRQMSRDEAAELANEQFAFDRATVLVLKASGEKRGHLAAIDAPIHDVGQRRDLPDASAAHAPAPGTFTPRGAMRVRTRTLPNGLGVVLLPISSVPTVDMRLIFGSGTADEPADRRGTALVAGHTLDWDLRYVNDAMLFAAVAGTIYTDVGWHHTTFEAHGLDMHLDLMLAGLRRWVRDGRYHGVQATIDAFERERKKRDDDGAFSDAWREALYGAGHPYVTAGVVRHTAAGLDLDDAARFRAAHYTPDNATIVIAGRFDPDLADRWIDYLFGDWKGKADRSGAAPTAKPHAASLAQVADTTQLKLAIAMPATGPRAQQLVARELLADIAMDVRHQLGASYGLDTELSEARGASEYTIEGYLVADRTKDALALLQQRLAQLKQDPELTARSFVAARARVLAHLASLGSADTVAHQVEDDVEADRTPISSVSVIAAVQRLTIEDMAATLGELDLAGAVIAMRGPRPSIEAGFAALGRTATYVETPAASSTAEARRTAGSADEDRYSGDFEQALTEQGPAEPITMRFTAGYAGAELPDDRTASGFILGGGVGYRFDDTTAIGVHASFGRLTGSWVKENVMPVTVPYTVLPVDLALYVEATGYDRLWGAAQLGLHLTHVSEEGMDAVTHKALGIGAAGGLDLVRRGPHRFGAYAEVEGKLGGGDHYAAVTAGVAYRR